MVRRWSRINEFNFSLKNKKLFFFKKSSKSKVFKLTVSTRKFFKKYSKFRRKAFNRLRHRSNWLIYSNVLKFWSYDYLNIRTFNKKSWSLNIYEYNFIIFNWSCVKNLNADLFFNLKYNIINLNSFIYRQISTKPTTFFFWNNFKNTSLSSSDYILESDTDTSFSLIFYDNLFYEIQDVTNIKKINDTFSVLFTNNFNAMIQQKLNFYKFLIYLTILDL